MFIKARAFSQGSFEEQLKKFSELFNYKHIFKEEIPMSNQEDSIIHESTYEGRKEAEKERAAMNRECHRHEGAGDPVKQPNHYKTGLVETIVSIKNILHHKGFQDYCVGNVVKYISRYRTKNGLEDLKKAKTYIEFLINSYEENSTK